MAVTPNLGLHQWQPGDSFLRTDFNSDFNKIDAAIKMAMPVVGTFTGDGTANRKIVLGFKPAFVILLAHWLGDNPVIGVLTETRYSSVCNITPDIVRHNKPTLSSGIILTDNGFQMGVATHFNAYGKEQVYIAFH